MTPKTDEDRRRGEGAGQMPDIPSAPVIRERISTSWPPNLARELRAVAKRSNVAVSQVLRVAFVAMMRRKESNGK